MSQTPAATEAPTPRRADARRNVEVILDAAERCLARDPDASMRATATEAGLGRVTIYGHFKSRQDLIEVVVRRVLAAANDALGEVDLTGDAAGALRPSRRRDVGGHGPVRKPPGRGREGTAHDHGTRGAFGRPGSAGARLRRPR